MMIPDNIIFAPDTAKLAKLIAGRDAYAIVDSNVEIPELQEMFAPEKTIMFQVCEKAKRLEAIGMLASALLDAGAGRDALIVGIGGGITTDITGFLAAVYMRGVACALVPTTLLAQCDAAIGGKNGVNIDEYKNILGTFRDPEFIYICPELASSADKTCGRVEMLKAFILADADFYRKALAAWKGGAEAAAETEMELLKRAIEIKSGITSSDFCETGDRRRLNLGHTFGHAIETATHGATPHGVAVACGILVAARIAGRLGAANPALEATLREDFHSVGIPAEIPANLKSLAELIKKDKKTVGGAIHFVFPEEIGKSSVRLLTFEEIEKAL